MTEDGVVRCYYDLQGDFTQFSLGNVRPLRVGFDFEGLTNEALGR